MTRRALSALTFSAAVIVLAACGAKAPPPSYVALDGDRPAATGAGLQRQALSAPVLVVAPLVAPDYLDRAEVTGRAGDGRLNVLEDVRWGEPPRQAMQRVLVESLSRALSPDWFVAVTKSRGDDAAAELLIDVERLEVDSDGQAVLAARWELRSLTQRNQALARGRADYVETAAGAPDSKAAAFGKLTRRFAADLAPVVRAPAPAPAAAAPKPKK